MKFKIKASDENLALLALLNQTEKQKCRNSSLFSDVIGGIVAAALIVLVTWYVELSVKEVELLNVKSNVVWQARVDATKENMDALANLHNFIKYDLKRSAYGELEDGRFIEGFAENSVTPLMFKDYMLKHKETMKTIKANSALLSGGMAKSTGDFLESMEQLISLNLLINFNPNRLFPIRIDSEQPKYPATAYNMISDMVDFFESNFLQNYSRLESEYRESLILELE